jgi:hypothetical protein
LCTKRHDKTINPPETKKYAKKSVDLGDSNEDLNMTLTLRIDKMEKSIIQNQ